ncbi:unnamed protein product [Cyclocybe aegerita]|uniref:Smr domain-containing protein n=1 Tax=Cyclocybe aegerita TaxID=1973307 RepID=A0A8S0XGJ8_CYCAE|nr:unnamed protein product [Cyclocybe aegerita]
MDVTFSILTGLGLRMFLSTAANEEPSNALTTALLGLWEGLVVHQLSGRSSSPPLDHVLAYGLRLAVDLLIFKNLRRMVVVLLWAALGGLVSEAIVPHASLRSSLKKAKERERDRKHRRARSTPATIPIIPTPLPPRVRAYRQPEATARGPSPSPLLLPPDAPTQGSTSPFPFERPATPPSFFLQETSETSLVSPKPAHVPSLPPIESSPRDALPVRPPSGLASIFDRSPDSGSPLPVPIPLPTPPESAQSAVPSDGLVDGAVNEVSNDTQKSRFDNQLYTIPEISSPEDSSTPQGSREHQEDEGGEILAQSPLPHFLSTTSAPLPVPNVAIRSRSSSSVSRWLSSQAANPNADAIFTTPFSPSTSPLPVRMHNGDHLQEKSDEVLDNDNGHDSPIDNGEQNGPNSPLGKETDGHANINDSDSDELRTPGVRDALLMETDNGHDSDPLLTPRHLRTVADPADDMLSPLGLDVKSGLDENSDFNANSGDSRPDSRSTPEPTADVNNLPIPGSLSQIVLLQPPLPPSGPLFRVPTPPLESPPAPSPSTIHSGLSDISTLSTRIPSKLYSRADELRQKARDDEKTRARLEEQRKVAEMEGRTMDALLLKVKVRDMDIESQRLHEKAARRYFASRNTLEISNKIDVHGLRPREAFDRIERAIIQASKEGKSVVRVIVGKGLHSANKQPTLKPAVLRELQRQKIPCEIDPRNPGVLNITLPPTSSTS